MPENIKSKINGLGDIYMDEENEPYEASKTEEAANNAANAEKNGAVVKTGEVATPVNIIALVLVALGGALTVTAIQKKKNRE